MAAVIKNLNASARYIADKTAADWRAPPYFRIPIHTKQVVGIRLAEKPQIRDSPALAWTGMTQAASTTNPTQSSTIRDRTGGRSMNVDRCWRRFEMTFLNFDRLAGI